ncbi:hypothetical protein O3P69_010076 [Scylla paramamosain]|uniref:Uncharacterized protein n=1 Tax=Scylla paramamosain TaxID=85552 RepID=A0AAW0SPN6_SCYPA
MPTIVTLAGLTPPYTSSPTPLFLPAHPLLPHPLECGVAVGVVVVVVAVVLVVVVAGHAAVAMGPPRLVLLLAASPSFTCSTPPPSSAAHGLPGGLYLCPPAFSNTTRRADNRIRLSFVASEPNLNSDIWDRSFANRTRVGASTGEGVREHVGGAGGCAVLAPKVATKFMRQGHVATDGGADGAVPPFPSPSPLQALWGRDMTGGVNGKGWAGNTGQVREGEARQVSQGEVCGREGCSGIIQAKASPQPPTFFFFLQGVAVARAREEAAREECEVLRQEKKHLTRQLQEALSRIGLLKNRLDELIQNYAAIAPVIDTKNRLLEEVGRLQEERREADQRHAGEVELLKKEMEESQAEGERRLKEAVQEEKDKALNAAEEAVAALQQKEEELKASKEELQEEQRKHEETLAEEREKLHEEQEQLRGRLAQLQKTINSRQLSDLDLFASKLQAYRSEFEEKLKERDTQLTEARKELQAARETLRHQQLLSVVRGVTTNTPTPHAPANAFHAPAHPSLLPLGVDGDVDVCCESEPAVKKIKAAHNRTQPCPVPVPPPPRTPTLAPPPTTLATPTTTYRASPLRTPTPASHPQRPAHLSKRVLYSGKSLLMEEPRL